MGRGLGLRQRDILEAMGRLADERGQVWLAPADVIARIEERTGFERTRVVKATLRLIRARAAASRGDATEAAIAERMERQGVRMSFNGKLSESARPAGLKRPWPRACEGLNPSRCFASLEQRGLIERRAKSGPGSRVRLV